jgi:hypothetical protein
MSIFYAIAMFIPRRIAMRAEHVVRKAAFIKINNDAAFAFIAFNFFLKDRPLFFACLWVKQVFYKSHPDALKHKFIH